MNSATYQPGSLVSARGREWIVLPQSDQETLHLRPLGAADDDATLIYLPIEPHPVGPASFPVANGCSGSNHAAGQLLRDALQLKLRIGAGPFRSFGNIAVEPRAYQLVPLLMALKQDIVRLFDCRRRRYRKDHRGRAHRARTARPRRDFRLAVLCPPHLCEQWQRELKERFHIHAEVGTC